MSMSTKILDNIMLDQDRSRQLEEHQRQIQALLQAGIKVSPTELINMNGDLGVGQMRHLRAEKHSGFDKQILTSTGWVNERPMPVALTNETQVSKFKVNDIVRISKTSAYYNLEDDCNPKCNGTVYRLNTSNNEVPVRWENGSVNYYKEYDLVLVSEKEPMPEKQTKGVPMLESIKSYVKENKNILLTIGVALILDHLVFGGAFRQKVQELVEGMLGKAKKQLEEK